MKKKYILISFAASLLALTGCNYNDKNFDGLDNITQPEDVIKLEYTLTEADYASVASNSTNKTLAAQADLTNQLKAVGTNALFSQQISAKEYLPAFMAAKWYMADAGSAIKVTYNESVDAPAYLADMAAAESYKVTAANYETVWDKAGVDYFSPSKPAATYLPRFLKAAMADATEGEYVVAEYNYSANDPSGDGEPGETYNSITDAIEGPVGEYNVKGTVAATYAQGFLLTDGKVSILVFKKAPINIALGDEVAVKGTTSVYSGAKQFGNTNLEITRLAGAESFAYPTTINVWAAEQMDAYVAAATNATINYIEYTGTLSISGNYYNVAIEGASKAIGSISYPAPGVVSPELNGKVVKITGYSIGVSGGKYVNTMLTSIAEADATPATSIGVVATSAAGTYTVQGQIVAKYARGFLVSDATGAILVYLNTDYEIGTTVKVAGAVSKYAGLNQYGNTAEVTVIAEGATVSYPTPYLMTTADLDNYVTAPYCRYVQYTGTLTISGNYYNVIFDDAVTAQGSLSYPITGSVDAELAGKQVLVTGYTIGCSSGKFVNTMITSVADASTPASRAAMAASRAAITEKRYAIYEYTGSAWAAATDAIMVNPADYTAMGISGNSFSSSYSPNNYLPQFLNLKFPYAQPEEVKAVAYFYKSGDVTSLKVDEYTYANGVWVKNEFIETKTDQFVFNGTVWNFDPSIVITLKKGDAYSKEFMLATVEGVKEHYGSEYIDSYGTGEFYYGSSGYYGNVDVRPSAWKQYAPYATMSDAEVREVIIEHAESGIFVFSLQKYHGDMDAIPGIDVTVTINYDIYDTAGSGVMQIKYLVTGKGQFEYIKDSYQQIN